MQPRRRFLSTAAAALAALGVGRVATTQPDSAAALTATPTATPQRVWLPFSENAPPTLTPEPTPTFEPTPTSEPTAIPEPAATPEPTTRPTDPLAYDSPLLGAPTGTPEQAARWLLAIPGHLYDQNGIVTIVNAYVIHGDAVGMDWFLALAQNFHETDHLRSWWSQRPRRNPAGIGVTGATSIVQPSYGSWAWKEETGLWHEGVSFERWDADAVKAHLGRLLAYAVKEPQNEAQRAMIDYALSFRSLPASYRGIATTIIGLNGKWAVPGSNYGQRIIKLRDEMRRM